EQMDRSERKLREKLTQGGYPDCCVDAAIDYVKSFHYLDDYRFASTYVRYHQDSLSRRQLEQKLMAKGIGRDDINCAIDSEYTADEEKHIAKLLEKKHYDPDNCDEKEFRRIYQFLMRRGFKSSQILSAMRSQLP
ncbi:MAG TPA: recombinase RecX, partial [Eubacterium sp.]|nr:recombinase RecX [Eubacterium sp.]